ncbi:NAD(P)-binding protein, partial [Aureobasidium melanogenum]
MAWTLVTPSSRGIGFALTRQLLKTLPPSIPIVATTRSDVGGTKDRLVSGLQLSEGQVSRLDVQECDVLSETSISTLARYCKGRYNDKQKDKDAHLRLGLVIPGMLVPEKAPDKIEYDTALQTLKLNLLAPMMLVKHLCQFLPPKSSTLEHHRHLPDRAVLALMSARVGSISDNRLGGWYSYRSSKAGLNQFVKSTDIYLQMKCAANAMCIGLHPGTVRTGLSEQFWSSTPKEKRFTPEFSAERLLDVVLTLQESGRGKCWDWAGKEIPP